MTKLNKVNEGFNKFCGPAVLSILTGKNTDECVNAIRTITPNYSGAGVTLPELLKAADRLGFKSIKIDNASDCSLFRSILMLAKTNGIYVIMVPRHFVVVEVADDEVFFCDNHTKEPIKAQSSARLQQVVGDVYKVELKPVPKLTGETIEFLETMAGYYRFMRISSFDNGEVIRDQIGYIKIKNKDDLADISALIRNEMGY